MDRAYIYTSFLSYFSKSYQLTGRRIEASSQKHLRF